ncbi:MAG TPA: DUF763 domain-containing protein [Candidatus Binatia bacterium]|nr:DUF763 domain-containing protein [Candidatus Binatia bacterium]
MSGPTRTGRRTGSADLPLHGGRVPPWLAERMTVLGRLITETIVLHYGRDEFLRRLAHPFWFQSFGAVMGMDWHSSGITTSVMGALKRGLAPVQHELGIYVCGGRGRHSRKTPHELVAVGERTGIDGNAMARASRLTAKVDSAAVQDGFELYLHSFVLLDSGAWVVVQQGMNAALREARRYHWLSEGLTSFVEQPHAAIDGVPQGEILNLTDARAASARAAEVELVQRGPNAVVPVLQRLREDSAPHLRMPAHHEVRASDVFLRRLHATMMTAASCGAADFEELLLTPGMGARSVAALARVSEVVHGAPSRFADPARFAFAHGGKDGHPFPVPLDVYDETIGTLRRAVDAARMGNAEKLAALRRLDDQSRVMERMAAGETFQSIVDAERSAAARLRGRTVFDEPTPGSRKERRKPPVKQLRLL